MKKVSRYRKRFGQVFLRDPIVVEKILHSANLATHETVLEIGPGRGILTAMLAQHANQFYAIELEAQFVATLQQRFATSPDIHIIQADARTYNYNQLPAPFVVVANLPYSMAMPILRRLFAYRQRLARLIIMLQHEVAARLSAPPTTGAYSALSIFFQYYATIHTCFDVSRHAFTPVPAVNSTVLSLVPYTNLPWPSSNETFFFNIVKSAFTHRRKTLRANLLAAPQLTITKAELDDIFQTLNLAANLRPQELHVGQFVQLAANLMPFNG
ncbi:MAG: 16S rRNA (adenine(1518)-N(6)/adenine(1519)-N(6))-dimethyltransferase RsmA [bacterium]|nr:16S rRNA (adenine(1518)-N(6)/adenine(1519)-N(6))-dimethyltransferase RsmA [bacterium]